jgi:hypothetical protein
LRQVIDKKYVIRRALGLLLDLEDRDSTSLRYVRKIPPVYTVSHIPEDSILLERKEFQGFLSM